MLGFSGGKNMQADRQRMLPMMRHHLTGCLGRPATGGKWALPGVRMVAVLVGLAMVCAGLRQGISADKQEADTSPQTQKEALAAIPFNKLTDEARRKVLSVVEQPTLFRRMPTHVAECDPDLHVCLIRNPELVVGMWQVMGASNMTAERTGPYNWVGNDGAGTRCKVELIYGTSQLHVIYSDGYYEGALFKRRINGRCILVLKSDFRQGEDGRSLVNNQLDVFLAIDNLGADLVAKTLHPLFGSTADANFSETTKFLGRVHEAAERNGAGMQRLADRLPTVDNSVKAEFVESSAVAAQRAAARGRVVPAAANQPAASNAPAATKR